MNKKKNIFITIILGIIIGFINGFFGGGGGMIAVPILTKQFNLTQKQAQATCIGVILPICVISAIIYMVNVKIDFYNLLSCAGGVCVGGTIGAFVLNGIKNRVIAFIFAGVMLVAGVKMLFV